MNEHIRERISNLRLNMKEAGIDATLLFDTDPHMSEYAPARYQSRTYLSGFNGSTGMLIITLDKAALWTDSRYFLQAAEQLIETGIDLVRIGIAGEQEPHQWLGKNLKQGAIVGTNEWCISLSRFRALKSLLNANGIILMDDYDLIRKVWADRPMLPDSAVYEHELKFACTSRIDKIKAIRKALRSSDADLQLLSALDDIAWTFNLRGNDVEYNPLFMAYTIVSQQEVILFINDSKLTAELKNILNNEGVELRDYDDIVQFIRELPSATRILFDPEKTNCALGRCISEQAIPVEGISIPCNLKAIKTDAEIGNIRMAMRKDGMAMVEFLYWFHSRLGKVPIDEYLVAEKLTEFRSLQPGYKGISFFPIVGYREHGAVVHFKVSKVNALPIEPSGFLLFDSGAQYTDGTTDITRTIALSDLTDRQKTDFTLVLKGMIALTKARFPVNTRGYHLDILARSALWNQGLNYGHGTGHGVGYFLNVHEGPMSIRQEFNDRVIEPGMVLSNEPGLYRKGEYGLRTENMMVCVKHESTDFGDFLGFDTLTLCPIDTRAIKFDLLCSEELDWLNNYHRKVYDELEPLLANDLKIFLKELTRAV